MESSLYSLVENCTQLVKNGKGTLILAAETKKAEGKTYKVDIQEGKLAGTDPKNLRVFRDFSF